MEQIFINSRNLINLVIQDHHFIKKHQILCLNKLDNKELYNTELLANFLKPTLRVYFENVLAGHIFEQDKIYIIPRIVTTDFTIRMFQYKILHNILFLNKKLFEFNKINQNVLQNVRRQLFICFIFVEKHKLYGRNSLVI